MPLFNVGTDSLRMILPKVMSAWTKMYDTADPEPLGELFSECWRDQSAWISHEVAWGKRNEIRPHVLRVWWNTRLPVRRRSAAHSGSAKSGAEIRESETALGKPPNFCFVCAPLIHHKQTPID